ncbi:hypothetical protein MIND_01365700 [Mycena indigotica]|uniref:Uncharacterized protein n=1 Tax=Mycena indigotica TaxID=2126181 RepID=A0A8H6VTV5_9AGAR|nr:uncharacterized protein MIND_01365700 [Mycena indigotica]KAF7289908.1 hypothetical protein MIND_01365700 [Mycena indigotica]
MGKRERVASESDASPSVVISNGDLEATRRRTVTYGLQPPPRARMTPWTELGTDEPPSDDDDDERPPLRMYALPHASASTGTAGSFGVRAPSAASNHDEGHLNGHIADRVSERSVSTGRSRASSVGNGASTSRQNSGRGRRWSTLPRRLTPPDNIPPATPSRSIPHPYAAASSSPSSNERSASRASAHSFGSNGTGKLNATGWTRGKRASGMSFQSVATSISETSSANASVGSLAMTGSGRVRTSMPPPPRPAPTTALPPAPSPSGSPNTQTSFRESRASSVSFREPVETQNASSSKSSFRESMGLGQRALRLSLMAPRPPPSGVLPPRPDEPPAAAPTPAAPTQEPPIKSVFQHRRSNSANATPSPSSSIRNSFLGAKARIGLGLDSIPGSPALPPPRGPLPPVPAASARHTSLKLKQRLRILSAPPAPHPQPPQSRARPTSAETIAVPIAPQATLASFLSISASTPSTPVTSTPILLPNGSYGTPPLGTPISEKIIHFNDASFLQMSASNASTPVISPMPAPAALENMSINEQDEPTQLVSLLPPPRRGSRQISVKDLEPRTPTPDQEEEEEAEERRDLEAEGAGPGPGKLFSLSRHGSVISLLLTTPTNPPM